MADKAIEQTLVLIKPDALKVSLTGYILSQFSEFHTGLRFAGAKIVHVSRMLAEEHYAEHKGKPFFAWLIDYITGAIHYLDAPHRRRVIALVYHGPEAVHTVRRIAGPTNPHDARETAPGTIRALGTVVPIKDGQGKIVGERMDNLVHASANQADAEREIKLWFKPNDIMPYMRAYPTVRCTRHYYYLDRTLYTSYVPGSCCVMAPGTLVWASDLETLEKFCGGEPISGTVESVVAKYLINEETIAC